MIQPATKQDSSSYTTDTSTSFESSSYEATPPDGPQFPGSPYSLRATVSTAAPQKHPFISRKATAVFGGSLFIAIVVATAGFFAYTSQHTESSAAASGELHQLQMNPHAAQAIPEDKSTLGSKKSSHDYLETTELHEVSDQHTSEHEEEGGSVDDEKPTKKRMTSRQTTTAKRRTGTPTAKRSEPKKEKTDKKAGDQKKIAKVDTAESKELESVRPSGSASQETDDDIYERKIAHGEESDIFVEDLCAVNVSVRDCKKAGSEIYGTHFLCTNGKPGLLCQPWLEEMWCLGSNGSRFRSKGECEKTCKDSQPSPCRRAQPCTCSGAYRNINYVYNARTKNCTLLPRHVCSSTGRGFQTKEECVKACGTGDQRTNPACLVGHLFTETRPCMHRDKLYKYYFDPKAGACEIWDGTACVDPHYTTMTECIRICRATPKVTGTSSAAQVNPAGRKRST